MNPFIRKLRARDEQVKQLNKLLEETAAPDGNINGKENKDKKSKSRNDLKPLLVAAPIGKGLVGSNVIRNLDPPESPVAPRRREVREAKIKVVLETPEEKLQSEEPEDVYDEVGTWLWLSESIVILCIKPNLI